MEVVNDIQASTTFATEPAEPDIMHRPPRSRTEPIVTKSLTFQILSHASTIFLCAIVVYALYLGQGAGLEKSRTMVFATLSISLALLAFFSRSERSPLYRIGLVSNKYMFYVLTGSLFLAFVVIDFPTLQTIFKTITLRPFDWLVAGLFSFLATFWIEVRKIIRFRSHRAESQS